MIEHTGYGMLPFEDGPRRETPIAEAIRDPRRT